MKEYEFNIGEHFQLDGFVKANSIEEARDKALELFNSAMMQNDNIEVEIHEVEEEV